MNENLVRSGCLAALVVSLSFIAACGGGTSSSAVDAGAMSANQADAFAKSLSMAAVGSMGSSSFLRAEGAAEGLTAPEQQQGLALLNAAGLVSCTPTSCMINQPISARRTCVTGGAINVTGNISGSISNTGSGVILISATETISDWSCLPPLMINGDPYISLTGTFSFLNGVPATQQHVGIHGGVKWGTAAAESCQISLDTNFNRDGTGRTTGTVCSHTIDVSF
jgi:hypothetical protein